MIGIPIMGATSLMLVNTIIVCIYKTWILIEYYKNQLSHWIHHFRLINCCYYLVLVNIFQYRYSFYRRIIARHLFLWGSRYRVRAFFGLFSLELPPSSEFSKYFSRANTHPAAHEAMAKSNTSRRKRLRRSTRLASQQQQQQQQQQQRNSNLNIFLMRHWKLWVNSYQRHRGCVRSLLLFLG